MSVRWFVARDHNGTVSHLIRVHETKRSQWGEYFQDGQWIEDASVLGVLVDNTWGVPVSPNEGKSIERKLRGG
jgi:hypothetical protein